MVQKGLFVSEATCFSPIPPTLPPTSRGFTLYSWPLAVHLNSTRKGCTLGTSSCCVWVQKITDFVNINVKVMIKCMSASPDNRLSEILFPRYDLIHRKPGNECSASAELTGRVQPIISKTLMLGYISSSAYFTHSIRFPGS